MDPGVQYTSVRYTEATKCKKKWARTKCVWTRNSQSHDDIDSIIPDTPVGFRTTKMELQLAYQQGLDDVRGRTRIELGDELRDKEERQKFEAEMAKGAFVLQGQRASALEQENMLLRRELLALTRENTAMRRHEDDKIGQQGDKIDLRRIHRLTSWGQSGVPVLFRVEWKENADFDIHLFLIVF